LLVNTDYYLLARIITKIYNKTIEKIPLALIWSINTYLIKYYPLKLKMDWLQLIWIRLKIWIKYWTSLNSERKKTLILDPISSYIYRVRDLKGTVRNLDYISCQETLKTNLQSKANTNQIKLIMKMLFSFL